MSGYPHHHVYPCLVLLLHDVLKYPVPGSRTVLAVVTCQPRKCSPPEFVSSFVVFAVAGATWWPCFWRIHCAFGGKITV